MKLLLPLLLATAAQADKGWVVDPDQALVSVEVAHVSVTSSDVSGSLREFDQGGVELRLLTSELTLEGTAPAPDKDGRAQLTGTLTLRGAAKKVTIPITLVRAGRMTYAHASFLVGNARIDLDAGLRPGETVASRD